MKKIIVSISCLVMANILAWGGGLHLPSYVNNANANEAVSPPAPPSSGSGTKTFYQVNTKKKNKKLLEEKVNLNKADVATLRRIPNITKESARQIVDYRKKNGPYKRVEDLLVLPAIGEKTIKNIKPYLVLK